MRSAARSAGEAPRRRVVGYSTGSTPISSRAAAWPAHGRRKRARAGPRGPDRRDPPRAGNGTWVETVRFARATRLARTSAAGGRFSTNARQALPGPRATSAAGRCAGSCAGAPPPDRAPGARERAPSPRVLRSVRPSAARRAARRSRSSRAASSATTSCTRPMRSARSASKRWPVDEQGARVRLADLRHHERADDRRDDAELRLGEAEGRVGGRDDDVGDRAQAHPAPERRALHAGDHRHRTAVDRPRTSPAWPPRPARSRRRTGRSRTASTRRPRRRRRPDPAPASTTPRRASGASVAERLERRPQLADQLRVEGVADLGARRG